MSGKTSFSIDGSGAKKASPTKESGGQDKKKFAMIGIAIVCLLAAGGVTAFQMGIFGGPDPNKPPTEAEAGKPYEETLDEKGKQKYKRDMQILEEQQAKQPKAGS